MKIKRSDYRSRKEYNLARKALNVWIKERHPTKKKKKAPKKETWNIKYKKYLKSEKWNKIKTRIHKLRGGKCERCNSKHQLQVHHKHYKNVFKEKMQDLELLCRKCHRSEHGLD